MTATTVRFTAGGFGPRIGPGARVRAPHDDQPRAESPRAARPIPRTDQGAKPGDEDDDEEEEDE